MAKRAGGSPAWMVTFADLMSLLLTFFILLLSYSQVDTEKYKEIAHSMQREFGIAWVKQATAPNGGAIIGNKPPSVVQPSKPAPTPSPQDRLLERFRTGLQEAIRKGLIEVTTRDGDLVVSFRHEAAFESGSETLIPYFRPIIDKIGALLSKTQGTIVVAGHTDNVPIHNARFRSNWDLSTARAVSVVHQLLQDGEIPAKRLVAEGFADTRPLVPNDNAEDRAKNRRVEIRVRDHTLPPPPADKAGETTENVK